MDFLTLSKNRYSCRKYDSTREIEKEKLDYILSCASTAPSACNGQQYHINVCTGKCAEDIAPMLVGSHVNKFAKEAPVLLVISEMPYVRSAAIFAERTKNDYRSMDIGILAAYITSAATDVGLGNCILGYFDEQAVRARIGVDGKIRLVITLGYSLVEEIPEKKRLPLDELVTYTK